MATVQDIYPLSPLQQGMLFHSLLAPASGVYVEQRWCLLEGDLNVKAFQAAWQRVASRHPVLRSEFHWEETEQPMQVVYDQVQLPWTLDGIAINNSGESCFADSPAFQSFLKQDRQLGFELDCAPLMRFALFQISLTRYQFVWTFHHLLMDGWCNGLLIKEVLTIYEAVKRNEQPRLSASIPYRKYIDWLEQRSAERDQAYWQKILQGFQQPTSLGIDRQQAATGADLKSKSSTRDELRNDYADVHCEFEESFSAKLQAFATKSRLTLNTLFQGAWSLLLSRYSGEKDVLFGATVSGRPPENEEMHACIGLFINTVPVRVEVNSKQKLLPWLETLQEEQRQRESHAYNRLLDLQKFTNVPNGVPLFDSLLVFENYPVSMEMALQGQDSGIQLLDGDGYEQTSYPLTLVVIPGEKTKVVFRFETIHFSSAAIERLTEQLKTVLTHFIEQPDLLLGDVSTLGKSEIKKLQEWSEGSTATVESMPVHERFRAQAAAHPDKIAISFQKCDTKELICIDYKTLEQDSNRLANWLNNEQEIGKGCRVGIFFDRCPELITCLLGVLKAGATYVPLDCDFPASRLRYMADDARLDLLLHNGESERIQEMFGDSTRQRLVPVLDDFSNEHLPLDELQVSQDDLAYIIYTSGSTGQPKGVTIDHGNLNNFLQAMQQSPGLMAEDKLLAVTTISFDIAALEVFLPLVTGAQIVLATNNDAREGRKLAQLINEHNITVMQATPATWRLLLETADESPNVWSKNLKVLCGGEALDFDLASRLLKTGCEVWNLYGPTETTIWSAALRLEKEQLSLGTVPIGGPILNTQLFVLDQEMRPVPLGCTGQLYIGGEGLSPGYWKQSGLTESRFRRCALATSEIVYATGDLVRQREDGLLDFLGRIDSQIKLRGFRIELGEIETAMQEHAGVTQAIAVLQANHEQENQLVAFLITVETASPEVVNELRVALRTRLPSYMVPSQFFVLDKFPLTLNGKVNRLALEQDYIPEQQASAVVSQVRPLFSSPREELLAGIWGDVLGNKKVSAEEHFFEIGGHSLAATRVMGRVRQTLGIDAPLRILFENPQLAEFATALEGCAKDIVPMAVITRLSGESKNLPLSDSQRRQWLMAGLYEEGALYSIPTAVRIQGTLCVNSLQQSLEYVVAKHDVLRMAFQQEDGEPYATVASKLDFVIETVDLTGYSTDEREGKLKEYLQQEIQNGFDLRTAPLWRAQLIQLAEDECVFLFLVDHILTDGWSLGIFVRELAIAYQLTVEEKLNEQEDLANRLQYTDYAAWQHDLDLSQDLDYWEQQLTDLPALLELPTDFVRPAEQSFAGASFDFLLNPEELAALRKLGQQQGTTLFMTLFTAFNVFLYRLTGCRDIAVGTPVANRPHPELEEMMGLFVNTLVLRTDLSGNPAVEELLTRVRDLTLEAYQHEQAPFEQVLKRVGAQRSRSSSPLFQVLFTLQNAPLEQIDVVGLKWAPLALETHTAKFDLSLSFRESDDGLQGRFEYRTDLFESGTIARFAKQFCNLLRELPRQVQTRLSSLSILNQQERDWLATVGQPSSSVSPDLQLTIHKIFSLQALSSPQAIALQQGEIIWTYQELEERSTQLAQSLRQLGVGVETRVGVLAEKSPETILTLLAILKVGGTYVPLDEKLPAARLEWLIKDAGCSIVLGHNLKALTGLFSQQVCQKLCDEIAVYAVVFPALSPAGSQTVEFTALTDSLAYILYTSGSTGQPKGVCTPHRGVTRLVRDTDFMQFGRDEIFLQTAPLNFDASTLEIWGPLLNGGKLVLPESSSLSLEDLAELVEKHRVTTLWLTAGLFHLMVDSALDQLTSVRQLLAGGDVLSVEHLCRARAVLINTTFINGYGPTEGTTFTCCHTFSDQELADPSKLPSAPIGRPIPNTRVYVLDEDLQQVGVGVSGELYLGGKGIARGYLNQPALTAEHFVPNPFFDIQQASAVDENITLYKTGDRVRYRADGTLLFLGRLDEQVKIRGYRIEPGEIESALVSHTEVQDVVVVITGEKAESKRLIAYLVPLTADSLTVKTTKQLSDSVRSHLLKQLPLPLVPTNFHWLSELPLNANGKVDRQALPVPIWESESAESDHEPTETEQKLLTIWASLLPATTVRLQDNFFDLGGDSILAMQIVSRALRVGLKITPAELFQHQTVAELALVAQLSTETKSVPSGLAEPNEKAVLPTPIQSWFFKQSLENPHHFNQATCLSLPAGIDHEALDKALAAVFRHHDALRLRKSKQQTKLFYAKTETSRVRWCEAKEFDATVQELQQSLHLDNGPLFQVAGFESDKKQASRLLIVAHHLVIDAVSWRILLEDFYEAYQQIRASGTILLPAKTASYQAWSEQLNKSRNLAAADYAYWLECVRNATVIKKLLPKDKNQIATIKTSEMVVASLNFEQTELLLQRTTREQQPSPHEVLITALTSTLQQWAGVNSLTVDLEGHGRDAQQLDIEVDVSRTVGWFTTLYPATLNIRLDSPDTQQLTDVIEQLQSVPNNGISYGLLRYGDQRDELAIQPLVGFNYLGQLDSGIVQSGFSRQVTPSHAIAGKNQRAHAFDINCLIAEQKLTVEWTFDRQLQDQAEIEKLATKFLRNVERLLTACRSSQPTELTTKQFELAQLKTTELDNIMSQISFNGTQE